MRLVGKLFKRKARLSVGPPGGELIEFSSDLKLTFNISKTIDAEPNKASIKIYNLNATSRSQIEQKGNVVKLELKYDISPFEIVYNGEIRFTQTKQENADRATFIESGDGDTAFNGILLNETIGPGEGDNPGVSVQEIFARMKEIFTDKMAEKFGSPSGSDPSVDADYDRIIAAVSGEATSIIDGVLRTSSGKFRKGKTLKGTFGNVMDKLSERVGVDFFINNQTMYVLEKTKILDLDSLLFTADTGLIGVPSKLEDGSIQIKTLIVPGLLIGRGIVVSSKEISSLRQWKTNRLQIVGDTKGPQWNATIDATLVGEQQAATGLGPPVPV